jgi:hypothetical protein
MVMEALTVDVGTAGEEGKEADQREAPDLVQSIDLGLIAWVYVFKAKLPVIRWRDDAVCQPHRAGTEGRN